MSRWLPQDLLDWQLIIIATLSAAVLICGVLV